MVAGLEYKTVSRLERRLVRLDFECDPQVDDMPIATSTTLCTAFPLTYSR
jgi:hypothetical protein